MVDQTFHIIMLILGYSVGWWFRGVRARAQIIKAFREHTARCDKKNKEYCDGVKDGTIADNLKK